MSFALKPENSTPLPADNELSIAAENLAAQEMTALWTMIMGITGICAVILSFVGVILIFKTFRETRRAAETAQATVKSFKNAERGSIYIERAGADNYSNRPFLNAWLTVSNPGRSKIRVERVVFDALERPENLTLRQSASTSEWVAPESPKNLHLIIPKEIFDESSLTFIGGRVEYFDQFSELHHTHFLFEMSAAKSQETVLSGMPEYRHSLHKLNVPSEWPADH